MGKSFNKKIYVLSERIGCTDPECCGAEMSPRVAYTSREDAEHEQKRREEMNRDGHYECTIDDIDLIDICLIEESSQ